jgi:CubicO group peptidase (beta-lactamase class C family)
MDYYHLKALSPAGSINSSVVEMANWLITWIYGGKFKGKEVIPSSYISEAISSQVVVSALLPSKDAPDQYFLNGGLGWGLSSYRGHYRAQHSGGIDGFSAHTCFFPTDSIGIVVLVNQDDSMVPTLVRNIIADKMLRLSNLDWSSNMKSQREKTMNSQKEAESKTISNRKSGTKPSQELFSYTGIYFNPGYGTIKIVAERDSLFAITPLLRYWLKHYHYDTFQPIRVTKNGIDISENVGLLFKFRTNDSGEIESIYINMEETVADIIFKRPYASIKNIK